MTALSKKHAAIRVVLPFVFRHWLKQPGRGLIVAGGPHGGADHDPFMAVVSGDLVDEVTRGGYDPDARRAGRGEVGAIGGPGAAPVGAGGVGR